MVVPDFTSQIHPSWVPALMPAHQRVREIGQFLRAEVAAGRGYLPAGPHILRAFNQPLDEVRVLILGQDPYPNPGHPVGLSFSVSPEVSPLPPSLVNVFTELVDDVGATPPTNGDLTAWAQQGVLLLNRVLTVRPGQAGSHRGKGWEEVTELAIQALNARSGPRVAILWGQDARKLAPMLTFPCLASPHPSPLSAYRGFFGSKPFSTANRALVEQGGAPIDWSLP